MSKYIACICEGGAERTIINMLLENHQLIFEKEDLIEEELLRCRSAKEFEKRHLGKGFKEKITVYRVLDSRRERFNLSNAYKEKVDVINVITAPEIEMLIILNEGEYNNYKKTKSSPSEYCKGVLKLKNVKSPDFIEEYFKDLDVLMKAIKEYHRVSNVKRDELTIWDLVKK